MSDDTKTKGAGATTKPTQPQSTKEPLPDTMTQASSDKPKMAMIDTEVLQQLIDSNKDMKARLGDLENHAATPTTQVGKIFKESKNKLSDTKLRKWNGNFVISFTPAYRERDQHNTREWVNYLDITCINDKGETLKPEKVELVDYVRNSETVQLPTLRKIKLADLVTTQGEVRKKGFVEGGYGMFETTVVVDVDVVEQNYEYEVKLPNGSIITVDSKYVG